MIRIREHASRTLAKGLSLSLAVRWVMIFRVALILFAIVLHYTIYTAPTDADFQFREERQEYPLISSLLSTFSAPPNTTRAFAHVGIPIDMSLLYTGSSLQFTPIDVHTYPYSTYSTQATHPFKSTPVTVSWTSLPHVWNISPQSTIPLTSSLHSQNSSFVNNGSWGEYTSFPYLWHTFIAACSQAWNNGDLFTPCPECSVHGFPLNTGIVVAIDGVSATAARAVTAIPSNTRSSGERLGTSDVANIPEISLFPVALPDSLISFSPSWSFLLGGLGNWDGLLNSQNAVTGYVHEKQYAFFPLYPSLLRITGMGIYKLAVFSRILSWYINSLARAIYVRMATSIGDVHQQIHGAGALITSHEHTSRNTTTNIDHTCVAYTPATAPPTIPIPHHSSASTSASSASPSLARTPSRVTLPLSLYGGRFYTVSTTHHTTLSSSTSPASSSASTSTSTSTTASTSIPTTSPVSIASRFPALINSELTVWVPPRLCPRDAIYLAGTLCSIFFTLLLTVAVYYVTLALLTSGIPSTYTSTHTVTDAVASTVATCVAILPSSIFLTAFYTESIFTIFFLICTYTWLHFTRHISRDDSTRWNFPEKLLESVCECVLLREGRCVAEKTLHSDACAAGEASAALLTRSDTVGSVSAVSDTQTIGAAMPANVSGSDGGDRGEAGAVGSVGRADDGGGGDDDGKDEDSKDEDDKVAANHAWEDRSHEVVQVTEGGLSVGLPASNSSLPFFSFSLSTLSLFLVHSLSILLACLTRSNGATIAALMAWSGAVGAVRVALVLARRMCRCNDVERGICGCASVGRCACACAAAERHGDVEKDMDMQRCGAEAEEEEDVEVKAAVKDARVHAPVCTWCSPCSHYLSRPRTWLRHCHLSLLQMLDTLVLRVFQPQLAPMASLPPQPMRKTHVSLATGPVSLCKMPASLCTTSKSLPMMPSIVPNSSPLSSSSSSSPSSWRLCSRLCLYLFLILVTFTLALTPQMWFQMVAFSAVCDQYYTQTPTISTPTPIHTHTHTRTRTEMLTPPSTQVTNTSVSDQYFTNTTNAAAETPVTGNARVPRYLYTPTPTHPSSSSSHIHTTNSPSLHFMFGLQVPPTDTSSMRNTVPVITHAHALDDPSPDPTHTELSLDVPRSVHTQSYVPDYVPVRVPPYCVDRWQLQLRLGWRRAQPQRGWGDGGVSGGEAIGGGVSGGEATGGGCGDGELGDKRVACDVDGGEGRGGGAVSGDGGGGAGGGDAGESSRSSSRLLPWQWQWAWQWEWTWAWEWEWVPLHITPTLSSPPTHPPTLTPAPTPTPTLTSAPVLPSFSFAITPPTATTLLASLRHALSSYTHIHTRIYTYLIAPVQRLLSENHFRKIFTSYIFPDVPYSQTLHSEMSFDTTMNTSIPENTPPIPEIYEDIPEYLTFLQLHIPWPLPSVYTSLQSRYWNIGFLHYYSWNQIPNFIFATPIFLFVLCISSMFFKIVQKLTFIAYIYAYVCKTSVFEEFFFILHHHSHQNIHVLYDQCLAFYLSCYQFSSSPRQPRDVPLPSPTQASIPLLLPNSTSTSTSTTSTTSITSTTSTLASTSTTVTTLPSPTPSSSCSTPSPLTSPSSPPSSISPPSISHPPSPSSLHTYISHLSPLSSFHTYASHLSLDLIPVTPSLLPLYLHLLVSAIIALFFMHIQVTTRFLFTNPVAIVMFGYLHVHHVHARTSTHTRTNTNTSTGIQPPEIPVAPSPGHNHADALLYTWKNTNLLQYSPFLLWGVVYSIVGTGMFALFLPWT